MKHASVTGSRLLFAGTGALTFATALVLGTVAVPAPVSRPQAPNGHHRLFRRNTFPTPIQHVIVIVQENRSVDNLFNGWSSPGGNADTVTIDPVTHLPLRPCSLYEQAQGCPPTSAPYQVNTQCDLSHKHEPPDPQDTQGFSTEYDDGAMDGFQNEGGSNCVPVNNENVAFSFVPSPEATQYWGFAYNYAFVNHALQSNSGPSFPAHQYLIAGQAAGMSATGFITSSNPWSIDENETTLSHHSCAFKNVFSTAVDLTSAYPGNESKKNGSACNGYETIFDALPSGLSWKYYTNNEDGLWGGPSAVLQDCNPNYSTGLCMNQQIVNCSKYALRDFLDGTATLANVTFVIPRAAWSDHPESVSPNAQSGPNWVTLLVNAIGNSTYWANTTIIVVWDDWGGWFDHYQPPSNGGNINQSIINCATNGTLKTPASCGFRVPIVVIGPYVKKSYVDTTATNAAGAILLYIEHTFGIGPLTGPRAIGALGSADTWTSDDLMNTMDFSAIGPRPFIPEPTSTPASWYLNQGCTDSSLKIR